MDTENPFDNMPKTIVPDIDVHRIKPQEYNSDYGWNYTSFFNAVARHDNQEYLRRVNEIDLTLTTVYHENVLHVAVTRNNLFVVENLMARLTPEQKQILFAQINLRGFTPLTLAAELGYRNRIAEILLENGDDPKQADAFGRIPLSYAIAKNNLRLVKILERYDPTFKFNLKDMPTPIGKCASYLANEEQYRLDGDLLTAIAERNLTAMKAAIAGGANVNINAQTRHGTPLIRAIQNDCSNEMIEELLIAGAGVNLKNKEGQTAIMIAMLCGRNDVAKRLLKCPDIDLHVRDVWGEYLVNYTADSDLQLSILNKMTKNYEGYKPITLLRALNFLLEDVLDGEYAPTFRHAVTERIEPVETMPEYAFLATEVNLLKRGTLAGEKRLPEMRERGIIDIQTPEKQRRIKYILKRTRGVLNRIEKFYQYSRS